MARRSLLVVANRLPVDETVLPDGTIEWSRSPGGLVSALHPVLRDRHGTWIGWSGGIDSTPFVPDADGIRMRPGAAVRSRTIEHYYEGFSNSHPLAALPRRGRAAGLPPALVGGVRSGSTAGSPRPTAEYRRARRDGVGARLPPAAGAGDAARAAPGPAHRLLPAHPVPAGRAVHAAAPPGRAAARACSAPTWSASRPRRRGELHPARRRLLGVAGRTPTRSLPCDGRTRAPGAFPISIDVDEMEELGRDPT